MTIIILSSLYGPLVRLTLCTWGRIRFNATTYVSFDSSCWSPSVCGMARSWLQSWAKTHYLLTNLLSERRSSLLDVKIGFCCDWISNFCTIFTNSLLWIFSYQPCFWGKSGKWQGERELCIQQVLFWNLSSKNAITVKGAEITWNYRGTFFPSWL